MDVIEVLEIILACIGVISVIGTISGNIIKEWKQYQHTIGKQQNLHRKKYSFGCISMVIATCISLIFPVTIMVKGDSFYKEFRQGIGETTVNIYGADQIKIQLPDGLSQSVFMDAVDVAVPAHATSEFFIATQMNITKQTRGVCPEFDAGYCKTDEDCLPAGMVFHRGNGFTNGTCSTASGTCFVSRWCSEQSDIPRINPLTNGNEDGELLFFIENAVFFSFSIEKEPFSVTNVKKELKEDRMNKCRFDGTEENNMCPYFPMSYILEQVGYKDPSEGGIITITIKWDCDFESKEQTCEPEYTFSLSRTGRHYRESRYTEDINKRTLVRSTGIWFHIDYEATGTVFSINKLFTAIGATLGYCSSASGLVAVMKLIYERSCKRCKSEHDWVSLSELEMH